jgi:tRNA pseudouridine38-40 synthase
MGRFKIFLEYEGTRYSGWQVQKNARTVQGEIHAALAKVLKTATFEFSGAGRTDAGVHALRQVAHLDAQTMLAPEVIRTKVNDELPADINLIEVEKAPATFHARHDAVARSYLYQISRRRTALGKRFVWWIKDKLDEQLMQKTLDQFIGMKDLQSFTDDDPEEKSTKVLIEEANVATAGELILLRIAGSHFLWKLVRRIVGVAAEVGRGKLDFHEVPGLFSQQSELPARLTAPPSGLFLERVYYKGDQRRDPLAPVMHVRSL